MRMRINMQASGFDVTVSGLAVKGPDGKLQRVTWFDACMSGSMVL